MSNPNRLIETATAKRFRLGELLPDAQNRRLRDWRVEQIAREFDFAKWSPPVVRENGNVQPTIIEGHHRVVAACKAGLHDVNVICYTHPAIETDAKVGEMYIGLNDTLGSTPTEKFMMRLRAGDKTAIAVASAIDGAGFDGITAVATDGMIHTPSACEWVYKGGGLKRPTPEALGFTLAAIKFTYGKTREGVRPNVVRGFGAFAHRYPNLLPKDVAKKVRERHPDVAGLIASTHTMAEALGSQQAKAMALVIRQDFNHQRKRRLDEW